MQKSLNVSSKMRNSLREKISIPKNSKNTGKTSVKEWKNGEKSLANRLKTWLILL